MCSCFSVPTLEGVALICVHYSHTGNLVNLFKRFARPLLVILEIVNKFMALIDVCWVHVLDFDPVLLSPKNLDMYAAAISECRASMHSIWGFLDCTIRQICHPSLAQQIAYNGYKKVHMLKFQAVMLPNRLIGHLFGPVEGCRANGHLLAESGLLVHCIGWAMRPGTTAAMPLQDCHFQLFGDVAYGVSHVMMLPFTT
jgi:hypothetical protein